MTASRAYFAFLVWPVKKIGVSVNQREIFFHLEIQTLQIDPLLLIKMQGSWVTLI